MTLTHVEGRVWRWIDHRGKPRYYYRRVLTVFENGVERSKDIRKALGTSLERAIVTAKRFDADQDAELRGEQPRRKLTLGEFIGEYMHWVKDERKLLGWQTLRANTGSLLRFLGPQVQLDRITRADLEAFLDLRRREVRPVTVCGMFRDVRRMFNVAIQRRCLEQSPAAGIRVQKPSQKEPRLPTLDDVRRLLDYLKVKRPWVWQIVITLIYTAARLGEALTLDWRRVDFTSNTLILTRRKVNDELRLEMAKPLADMLFAIWTERGMPKEGYIFVNRMGEPKRRGEAYLAFKREMKRLGMDWLTLKVFRKLAATWTMQGTRDIRSAQMLLGHADIRTTQGYLGGGAEARSMAVKAIADRLKEPD